MRYTDGSEWDLEILVFPIAGQFQLEAYQPQPFHGSMCTIPGEDAAPFYGCLRRILYSIIAIKQYLTTDTERATSIANRRARERGIPLMHLVQQNIYHSEGPLLHEYKYAPESNEANEQFLENIGDLRLNFCNHLWQIRWVQSYYLISWRWHIVLKDMVENRKNKRFYLKMILVKYHYSAG